MKRSLVVLLALPLLAAACSSPPVVQDGVQVRILPTHVHTRYCGHYYSEAHWYYVRNHKHAVNCGHTLEEGMWVKKR